MAGKMPLCQKVRLDVSKTKEAKDIIAESDRLWRLYEVSGNSDDRLRDKSLKLYGIWYKMKHGHRP